MFHTYHLWYRKLPHFVGGIILFLYFTLKFTSVATNIFNPPLPPSLSTARLCFYLYTVQSNLAMFQY
jgi:hypothetical protein